MIRLHISSLTNYLFPLILTDVLAATRAASSIKQAQESSTLNVENNSMMPIFQSPSLVVDTSMLGAPKPDENNQGNDEQFSCIFFGARFSQESVIDEALKELVHNLAMEEEKSILSIECRAYRALSPDIVSSERLVSQHQGPILVVYMTPSPDSEEEFNKWYDEEHIPMLSVVPGWLSAKRFVLCASNYLSTGTMAEARKAPKYLALHELEDTQVFEKPEYRDATSTPWRTEVMKSLKEKQRSVMGYVGQLTELAK
jgi:hypothetical protein